MLLANLLLGALLAQATPAPVPTPTPLPSATPTFSPTSTPWPVPTFTPRRTPAPLPTPLVLAPNNMPQILAVQVNDPVIKSGKVLSCTVITSTNVAAVEVRLRALAIRLRRGEAGVWHLAYVVPRLPPHPNRNLSASIVAMNAAGARVSRPIVLLLR